jgi:16S rRNA (guanine527-N7)-methyltransferase
MTRHFLDSLTAALAVPVERQREPLRLIDVGSGAGLPGLALAIAFPAWHVTLLDSIGKKTAFLRHACAILGLEGRVMVVTGRAEDAARDPLHRAAYDVATARAVAALATLAEYLLPFCRDGGQMLVLKKGDLAAEVAAAAPAVALLGGAPLRSLRVPDLADLGSDRVVLVSTKTRATPARYPRRAGLPAREPLGATRA